MSKIITIPSTYKEIEETILLVDGFIIGIEDMCVNMNYCISLNDLDILNNFKDKDIFISLNKNMHNKDLDIVKSILIELNKYNIKGVLYYDIAVVNIYNSLDLNYDLVWAQEHATTNYNTINYWKEFNVNYTYISSDITQEEIKDIKIHSNSMLLVNFFGYLPMFVSKRHIVKNYLEYFKLSDNSNINYIEKENNIYPIIDNKTGTIVYSSNILNGIKSYLQLDIECAVLNSFNIELEKFIKVINMFKLVNHDTLDEYESTINNMFTNIDSGFLNKKTIYKVKKNEK